MSLCAIFVLLSSLYYRATILQIIGILTNNRSKQKERFMLTDSVVSISALSKMWKHNRYGKKKRTNVRAVNKKLNVFLENLCCLN